MVIGEAPGRVEDEKGRPFAGPAGVLLWRELARVGIEKANVFADNAVSCYPGRTPTNDEMFACRGNLYNSIGYCNPDYILALGRTANNTFIECPSINAIRGKWYKCPWYPHNRHMAIMPTLHPAAVLRNKTLLRKWREDLKVFADVAVSE